MKSPNTRAYAGMFAPTIIEKVHPKVMYNHSGLFSLRMSRITLEAFSLYPLRDSKEEA